MDKVLQIERFGTFKRNLGDSSSLFASDKTRNENTDMKIARNRITALAGLAGILLTATSAHAAVILASNFNDVVKTAYPTATNITWDTVNGIETPAGSLTFTGASEFQNVTANEIDVAGNLPNWSTSVALVLDAATASIALSTLDFNWRVTTNGGADNTSASKSDTWTAEVIGSVSGSLGTASIGPAAPGNPTQFRSIDLSSFTINNTETWTLSLGIVGTGFGHNASLQDIEINGDITAIPEPSAALLGGLGALFLLRRRRI